MKFKEFCRSIRQADSIPAGLTTLLILSVVGVGTNALAASELAPPSFCIEDQCVTSTAPSPGPAPAPEPVVPPSTGNPSGNAINWNPGVYFGFKAGQFLNDDGTWKSVDSVLRNNAMCKAGGENIKGVRLRLEWAEYEPELGNYHGDEIFDALLEYLSSGKCGGIPRSLAIQTDFMANKKDARERLCVPLELRNSVDMIVWANDGGRDRCAARLWSKSSNSAAAYDRLWRHIALRYGNSPYVEQFSAKLEGALGVNDNDSEYSNNGALNVLLNTAATIRDLAPRVGVTLGTNNFKSGGDDRLIDLYKPEMEQKGGMGLSWPDTWADSAPGPRGVSPTTRHEAYYNQFHGDHMMWGEWQIPGNRFVGFDTVFEACCDKNYKHPKANPADFKPANPSSHAFGSTHVTVITTFKDFPVEDAIAMFDSHPRGYNTFDMTCPDSWVRNGLQCSDIKGRRIQ